jgi:protein tyrosine/serine phosphatase
LTQHLQPVGMALVTVGSEPSNFAPIYGICTIEVASRVPQPVSPESSISSRRNMQGLNRFTVFVAAGFLTFTAASVPTFAKGADSASPAPVAQRLNLDGVGNFARVSDTLYRGAQPNNVAYNELKNIGVSVVVDFRDEKAEIAKEKASVESAGMQFISLPWSGRSIPTHDEVVTFLNLMRDTQGKKVFVHCKEGRDRTGTMVALYRITFNHWTVDQALEEMHEFKYHATFLPGLAKYVKAYPSALAGDPTLAVFATVIAANPVAVVH